MNRKEVRYMKKKIMIGAVVPLVVSLGLWFAIGSASAARTTHTAPAQHQTTVHTKNAGTSTQSENSGGTETENSGGTETENSGGTETENSGGTETENSGGTETEGAADAAAQHADCLKVGIDDTVTPNVQYDDQTGACSLDTGTDNGGN
ncbi:MAG: hypothetical protein HY240_03855 [Actinobacteria bacterium]|nr:hypothetical protein [Actinomycetota bacterium]